jgi:small nuclear ribonucleoprotein (snRNP)-like protein
MFVEHEPFSSLQNTNRRRIPSTPAIPLAAAAASPITPLHLNYRMASAGPGLESLVDQIISVITNDGRNIVGTLRGFDQATNIILDESHERVYSTRVGLLPTLSTLLSCYLANLQLILQQYQYFTKLVLYALIIRQHTLYFHLHKVMFTRRSYLQLVTLLNFSAFRISTTVCLAFSIELPVC